MPAPKPPQFRRRAVELARRREQPIAQIAKDLGISESCLRRWMDQADVDEGATEGLTSAGRRELVELRRRTRVLEMENEILKRASAYLGSPRSPYSPSRPSWLPTLTEKKVRGIVAEIADRRAVAAPSSTSSATTAAQEDMPR
jgi:transposase-like protein